MDQLASVSGRRGCALLIDCRTLETKAVPLPKSVEILVVDSGARRRLADSGYAARRAHCEAVAANLGLGALRDATLAQVRHDPLARHVVLENDRVLAAVAALEAGDVVEVGRLMIESHASLRDDFEVSTPELDQLVDLLLAHGALGARLTGAGFGGCVVALVPTGHGERIASSLPRSFVVRAVDGASA